MTRSPSQFTPFCPVHMTHVDECDARCRIAREEFLRSSDALRKYWPVWRQEMVIKHGRGFFGDRAA